MEGLVRLFDEVRLLEHRLVQVIEQLHGTEHISVAGRGVLEFLLNNGATSVPDIARARYVSRQHIQTIADALVVGGLIVATPNPAHRRSSLFGLTELGHAAITAMHQRERDLMQARSRSTGLTAADLEHATVVLAAVRNALTEPPLPPVAPRLTSSTGNIPPAARPGAHYRRPGTVVDSNDA